MDIYSYVESARAKSPWDFGNNTLYALCRDNPEHTDVGIVVAKIWLIGRSYAAAIERRKNKADGNDDFYVTTVAPAIIKSGLDAWIRKANNSKSWGDMIEAHHKTTQLFNEISGLEKRSLASKYLHFHVPKLFYIYDTRAVAALRKLKSFTGRAGRKADNCDNEYRKLAEKCRALAVRIKQDYNIDMSPREIDNFLLAI